MALNIDFSKKNLQKLESFIEHNRNVDFKFADLSSLEAIEGLKWTGLKKSKEGLIPLVLAYQRVIRFLPENREALAMKLLENGVHSALQITALSRKAFMNSCLDLFNGDPSLAESVYQKACEVRSAILLKYMNGLQNNEPHISAARFC